MPDPQDPIELFDTLIKEHGTDFDTVMPHIVKLPALRKLLIRKGIAAMLADLHGPQSMDDG